MADDTAPTRTNARPNLPMYLDVGGLVEFIDDMMARCDIDPRSKISVELHTNSTDHTRTFDIVGIEAHLCSFEPDTFVICIEED
ncbi:hypothetical protein [Nannocystis sp.]|uniref:hypothetical protein n=1 Tax=Nannocystis sp. TaxID=1962667 RepID=UPI0025E6DBE1|nr:hypothetical protein [Nannocystis sp.]MBK7829664.1 hypothetical protein [Nannocystis sp.]